MKVKLIDFIATFIGLSIGTWFESSNYDLAKDRIISCFITLLIFYIAISLENRFFK